MPNEQDKRNIEFLNKIYQNATMGEESISFLTDKISDSSLLSDLYTQHGQYTNLAGKVSAELAKLQALPRDNGPMAQIGVWSGIQMNTMVDKSSSHIAEMMIQGSMMGVIDMTKSLKQHASAPKNIKDIGYELIKIEEDNIQRMKEYL